MTTPERGRGHVVSTTPTALPHLGNAVGCDGCDHMRDRHPEVKLSVTASTLAAARFRSLSVTCAAIFANDLWAIWRAHHGRTVLSANKRLFLLVLLHALTQRHVRCESLLVLSLFSSHSAEGIAP